MKAEFSGGPKSLMAIYVGQVHLWTEYIERNTVAEFGRLKFVVPNGISSL